MCCEYRLRAMPCLSFWWLSAVKGMLLLQDVGPLGCWLGGLSTSVLVPGKICTESGAGCLLRPLCSGRRHFLPFWEVPPGGFFRWKSCSPGGYAAYSFHSLEWNQHPPLSGWKFVSVEILLVASSLSTGWVCISPGSHIHFLKKSV